MNPQAPSLGKVIPIQRVGDEAVRDKGWWAAHRFLLLRRLVQLGIFTLFLLGPMAGVWIVKGNLSSSLTLGVLPLTDPFALAQVLATRHWPELSGLLGALIVVVFYALVGGRVFCSWVCPVNVATDSASWLRRRFNLTSGRAPKDMRFWLIPAVLGASAISGVAVWEWVNPVSLTQRALIFGGASALGAVGAVFLFDLLVAPRGWCGHLCPVGAFYSLIGRLSLLRVRLPAREACNDCMDCFAVCPEQQVIRPALKAVAGAPPVILEANCTNCGRCIDVCSKNVFAFGRRN